MSEELNVTDAEGGWRVVTADDVSAMMSELASLRAELEAAKQLGTDLSNELTHRTTKLAEARLWLDSSESALQEAQRALFRWLPNRIGSEYDDLIAADAMALMGLESTEGLREIGNEILVELMEKRRLLDNARAPLFWYRPHRNGMGYDGPISDETIEQSRKDSGIWVPLCAVAPVPAQPAVKVGNSFFESWYSLYNPEGKSTKQTMREAYEAGLVDHEGRADKAQPAAVPEAVAKDAAAILVQALEEIAWQRPLGVRPSKSGEAMERAAIIALHKYNALLSAADTEVKK